MPQVVPKRTNQPGISTTDRGFPRGRGRGRSRGFHSPGYFSGYRPRTRGRGMYRSADIKEVTSYSVCRFSFCKG